MPKLIPSRNILINLAVAAVSTVLCLLAAELVLRTLGFHGDNSFRVEHTIAVDDPLLNWRHVPNSVFYANNIVYHINASGFRDHLYPYQKPPNTFRIFLASDSVGFGSNVQMHDSYPKILEAKLNALNLPYRVEVLNHSMPGLSLKQKFHLVTRYASRYTPDLIIIDYVLNDVAFESRLLPPENRCNIELINMSIPCEVKSSLKRSAALVFVHQGIERILHKLRWDQRNHSYEEVESDYYQRLYLAPSRLEYLETLFRQMEQYQRDHDVPIVVPVFPLIYNYPEYKWRNIHQMIAALCRRHGLRYIELLDVFNRFDYNEMRVQRSDFHHPSVKGNIVAADAILAFLVRERLLRPPADRPYVQGRLREVPPTLRPLS